MPANGSTATIEASAGPPGSSAARAGLRGVSGPDRYLSALFDHVFAFLIAFVIATLFGDDRRNVWAGVSAVSAYVLYFLLGEGMFSSTPGKAMFGLRVVTLQGQACGLIRAMTRTLTRFIEVNPILLGGLPAAALIVFTPRRQRLGDLIARTVVVRKNDLDEDG